MRGAQESSQGRSIDDTEQSSCAVRWLSDLRIWPAGVVPATIAWPIEPDRSLLPAMVKRLADQRSVSAGQSATKGRKVTLSQKPIEPSHRPSPDISGMVTIADGVPLICVDDEAGWNTELLQRVPILN